ncbi:hypothetical protein ROZALSC1DRAFT_20604 [Rozella allomycis CSF55]|uniref:Uncharacterized protein n=1 Tax=Rozella allomycis (strain CSF55) TaxID=988480 RepID=A0A4P9YP01_ROZAC|nr:hypothetical protein ROZALSC1DRAFT_20604 [Rozella allomycis CSF55]
MFGFRHMFAKKFSIFDFAVGGELYFKALEKTGGLSLGTRWTTRDFRGKERDTTITLNPVMGHISSTYTLYISRLLEASCRFEFNLFSFDSMLALGFRFVSPLKDTEWIQFKIEEKSV